MRHFSTPSFWENYDKLPKKIKKLADNKFNLLKNNPYHPSLHFKKVGEYYSTRISSDYRALATKTENDIIWFWIGKHSDYEDKIN